MKCINHPDADANLVPWWPCTHFLDVECGICPACATGDCKDLDLVALGSEEFWTAFEDMKANHWARSES